MSDKPPPPPPYRPIVANPKGSFYDQGLQPPETPPAAPEETAALAPPSPAIDREGTDDDGKAGYRGPLVSPPPIEPPRQSDIIVMANPKGSYYDRGLYLNPPPESKVWRYVLLAVVLGVASCLLVFFLFFG